MKLLIYLTLVIGTFSADKVKVLNPNISTLDDLEKTILPSLVDELDELTALLSHNEELDPAASSGQLISEITTFKNRAVCFVIEAKLKRNDIISKVLKNGQVIPSQVAPAIRNITEDAKEELYRLYIASERISRAVCGLVPILSKTSLASTVQQTSRWANYLFKSVQCKKLSFSYRTNKCGHCLDDLVVLFDSSGNSLTEFFGGMVGATSDLNNILKNTILNEINASAPLVQNIFSCSGGTTSRANDNCSSLVAPIVPTA